MLLTAAALCSVAGCAWLALAMEVHWRQVQGSDGPRRGMRYALRALGICGLVASGALCLIADRPSMAALVWIMLLAGGALSVALVLAWKPVLVRLVWPRY